MDLTGFALKILRGLYENSLGALILWIIIMIIAYFSLKLRVKN